MAKVSIIVPVYNVEKYLRKCVDSLVNQTLDDIEIILVSDASPDGCNEIMKQYQKKYPDIIKCIYLTENIKQGGARNQGIKIATGEYIAFVDSDDYTDVTMCEKLYRQAIEGNCDIVYCDYYDNFLDKGNMRYMSFVSEDFTGEMTEDKQKVLLFTMVPPYGKLIRTKLIKDNEIYFPEKMFYEDVATTLLYHLYAKKVGLVREPLYYYSVRSDSTVGKKNSQHHFDEAKAGLLLYERFKNRGFYELYRDEIDMLFLIYFYLHPIATAVEKFETPSLEYLDYLKKNMEEIYPNYEQNPYFKLVDDAHRYDYIRLNDDSPEKFRELIISGKYDKRSASYYDYYTKSIGVIEQFFRSCKEQGKRIGVWGAGKRGQDFLAISDPDATNILAVFDNNEHMIGKKLEFVHGVFKFLENYDKVDIILCMNRFHYQAIKNEIVKLCPQMEVIDFDLYLQFRGGYV